eukprot:GHVR01156874.1.p1 GENE.GHVR01156874.1~~GHVR01156874.1.p1  ORF type:complete len:289 (+),score=57.86 GHVR01156874.1:45-911(+)
MAEGVCATVSVVAVKKCEKERERAHLTQQDFSRHEKVLVSRNSILTSSKDLSFVLRDYGTLLGIPQPIKTSTEQQQTTQQNNTTRNNNTQPTAPNVKRPKLTPMYHELTLQGKLEQKKITPIIVVPSSGIITLFNVSELIEKSIYIDSITARNNLLQQGRLPQTKCYVPLSDGKKLLVELRDSPSKFTDIEWYAVIGFFFGADWQLRGLPFVTPQKLFESCRGFHAILEGESLPPTVQTLNIMTLYLSSSAAKRHKSIEAQSLFCKELSDFIYRTDRKCFLDRNSKIR